MERDREDRVRERVERKKRLKAKRRKRIRVVVFEFFVLAILVGAAYVMRTYDQFQSVKIDAADIVVNEGVEKTGYMTVVLYGGDSREGALEKGTHADTIIVASIDAKTKEIRLASVYRDTFLKQEDGEFMKANNAYFVGGPEEGINNLNMNLDLDVQDYVTIDFKALVDAIDLIGGIELPIKEDEIDPINEYITETATVAGVEPKLITESGTQLLDGAQAVTYARIRSTEGGDYRRTERQRLVIEETLNKVASTNLKTINDIVQVVFPQVSTSFSLADLLLLATDAQEYTIGDAFGFPEDVQEASVDAAGSVVLADDLKQNVATLHERLYPNITYESSSTVNGINEEINALMLDEGIELGKNEE